MSSVSTKPHPSSDTLTIHTSLLFDSLAKKYSPNLTLTVSLTTGLITSVHSRPSASVPPATSPSAKVLDLRGHTILPGFVDSHAHIFLHAYSETPSINQERDESLVERIVRATVHCRSALKAGYTTYRDPGTEGVGDADVGLRDTINRGIIPGPRMFVATEPLASSGSYEIRYESAMNGTRVPRISDPCDGVDGVRAGVRRRIGKGADFIKVYADYRRRTLRFPAEAWQGALPIMHPPGQGEDIPLFAIPRNPVSTMWSQEEMTALVHEARRALAPVAAHAINPESVIMAARAGVTTIEHCYIPSDEALAAMKDNDVIFVPTLTVLESEIGLVGQEGLKIALEHAKQAFDMGIKMAAGGDIGAVNHGENVRELELLHKAGIPLEDVLQMGTARGWEACGGDWCGRRFGWLGEGWSADLVAVPGDLREVGVGALRDIRWVIKDGRVWVGEGRWVE